MHVRGDSPTSPATTPVQIPISAPGAGRYSPGKGDQGL